MAHHSRFDSSGRRYVIAQIGRLTFTERDITMSTVTSTRPAPVADVLDAMRDIQTEGDRWHLADALVTLIPSGETGFSELIDQATAAGVVGKLKVATLRLYRDTAKNWPAADRIANISFSAHREAVQLGSSKEGAKMLNSLAKSVGPANVTVAQVRKAVQIAQGKTPTARTLQRAAGTSGTSSLDPIADLVNNSGKKIVALIPADMESSTLDDLIAGLNHVLAFAEDRRMKANRKAASKATAKAAPAAKTAAAAATPAPKKQTAAKAGDLRGL
jgi:hypothetical protein